MKNYRQFIVHTVLKTKAMSYDWIQNGLHFVQKTILHTLSEYMYMYIYIAVLLEAPRTPVLSQVENELDVGSITELWRSMRRSYPKYLCLHPQTHQKVWSKPCMMQKAFPKRHEIEVNNLKVQAVAKTRWTDLGPTSGGVAMLYSGKE